MTVRALDAVAIKRTVIVFLYRQRPRCAMAADDHSNSMLASTDTGRDEPVALRSRRKPIDFLQCPTWFFASAQLALRFTLLRGTMRSTAARS